MTLYAYRDHEWYPENVKTSYDLGIQLKLPDDQYRFDSSDNLLMMTGNTGGWGAFSSTLESESYRFSELIGSHFKSTTQGRTLAYMPELLGAKYVISEEKPQENVLYSLEVNNRTFYISAQEACPIGFAVERWMREEELISLPWEKRAPALMNAFMVGRETGERLMQGNVPQMMAEEALELEPRKSIQRTVDNAVQDFVRSGHGFSCRTEWEQERFVYFTVPYDDGWHAEIDGAQAEIINSGGMMVLPVPSGEHRITFIFHTPGFTAGITISAILSALFLLWLFWKYRHRRQLLR